MFLPECQQIAPRAPPPAPRPRHKASAPRAPSRALPRAPSRAPPLPERPERPERPKQPRDTILDPQCTTVTRQRHTNHSHKDKPKGRTTALFNALSEAVAGA